MHTKLHTENSFTPHVTATRGPWHRDVPSIGVLASTKPGVRRQSEKRRLKINYPGTGNNSQFTCDGNGHVVNIVETVAGTVSSTKQLVWDDVEMKESRNSTGAVTAQFFSFGEAVSGSSYYWTKDHLASVREMTNSSGVVVDERFYDSFGRATQIQGSVPSDFQFAGYYCHLPSKLDLATFRDYNPNLARWISRDPIGELSLGIEPGIPSYAAPRADSFELTWGAEKRNMLNPQAPLLFSVPNLYAYCGNEPIRLRDPWGLQQTEPPGIQTPGAGQNAPYKPRPPQTCPLRHYDQNRGPNGSGPQIQNFDWTPYKSPSGPGTLAYLT